jgi:hypothetical protein
MANGRPEQGPQIVVIGSVGALRSQRDDCPLGLFLRGLNDAFPGAAAPKRET